jgi:ABC-type xylose transport system substrate-binding protein
MYITGYDGSRVAMRRVLTGGALRSSIALPLKAIGASAIWVPANLIEGKKPSFFEDVKFLLIGPAWLLGFVYRRLGVSY